MNRILKATLVLLLAAGSISTAQTVIPVNSLASPRLADLEKQLLAGNRAALESFWRDVAQKGSPLIEPIKGNAKYVLVTFLWRASGETRNVLLISIDLHHLKNEQDIAAMHLKRLADSDLWFKSYRLRNDARVTYQFSPNDSLIPPAKLKPEEQQKLIQSYKADPLNSLQTNEVSIAELPAAPPQPWIKPQSSVPEGKIEEHQFKSTILNNERKLIVYKPANYKTSGPRYHLLLAFTGQFYMRSILPPVTLNNLIGKGAIPPIIVVGVGSAPGYHIRDLGLYGPFADFLAQELMPWIRQNYHVTNDPAKTIVAGSSIGGLAASFVALKHPELFGNVLSNSGSYWFRPGIVDKGIRTEAGETVEDDFTEFAALIHEYVKSPRLRVRFFLEAGWLEDLYSYEPSPWKGQLSLLAANRYFRDVLKSKGYFVHYQEFNGGHSEANWRGSVADGLIVLIGQQRK